MTMQREQTTAPHGARRAHRPRAGKRARDSDTAATAAVAVHNNNDDDDTHATRQQDNVTRTAVAAATTQPKTRLLSSAFATQRAALCDAEAIAAYVREHHATRLRTCKQLLTFLQAIGGRSPRLYAELCARHKREVTFLLDRLYAHASLASSPSPVAAAAAAASSSAVTVASSASLLSHIMTPHAHEFVLRCEACGVHKSTWAMASEDTDTTMHAHDEADVDANDTTVSATTTAAAVTANNNNNQSDNNDDALASLFTARELITRLRDVDVVGRTQRMIEMCCSIHDVARCARRLQRALVDDEDEATSKTSATDAAAAAASTSSSVGSAAARVVEQHAVLAERRLMSRHKGHADLHDYATQCRLVSKLMSKMRRVVTAAVAAQDTSAHNDDDDANDDEEHHTHNDKDDDDATRVVAMTSDELAVLQACVTRIIDMVEYVLQRRADGSSSSSSTSAQSPIGKCAHFARWCATHHLIADADSTRVAQLEARAMRDAHAQAAQLETVLRLKALPHVALTAATTTTTTEKQKGNAHEGDDTAVGGSAAEATAALTRLLDELWRAGKGECFVPHSADVLSSIATAASAPHVPASVRADVADRLAQTHQYLMAQHARDTAAAATRALTSPPPQLPRRALRLVQAVQQERKRVVRARQLAADAAAEEARSSSSNNSKRTMRAKTTSA